MSTPPLQDTKHALRFAETSSKLTAIIASEIENNKLSAKSNLKKRCTFTVKNFSIFELPNTQKNETTKKYTGTNFKFEQIFVNKAGIQRQICTKRTSLLARRLNNNVFSNERLTYFLSLNPPTFSHFWPERYRMVLYWAQFYEFYGQALLL